MSNSAFLTQVPALTFLFLYFVFCVCHFGGAERERERERERWGNIKFLILISPSPWGQLLKKKKKEQHHSLPLAILQDVHPKTLEY
jgi:hypothetical protein